MPQTTKQQPPAPEEIYLRYTREHNEKDLETLLVTFREGLFLFILSFVKNEEDAEDLMLDTFAKLAVDSPHFSPGREGSFKGWLYAIARNNTLMHIRRRKLVTYPPDEELEDTRTPESALLRDEKNRMLYSAMSSLKPEYCRALELLYIEGFSHTEIAQAMGLNTRQVYNLIDRGKASLRKKLEKLGVYDAQY